MPKRTNIIGAIKIYKDNLHLFQGHLDSLLAYLNKHPDLQDFDGKIIHSIKYRLKDPEHLKDKIRRKAKESGPIHPSNIFQKITDLAGIRILHLHRNQIIPIHKAIMRSVLAGDFVLAERPKAYSWDPENSSFFNGLGLKVEIKPSYYTSVHYLVKPTKKSILCCEIQVRTLFEEIWGEIDHNINYPEQCEMDPIRDQLKVLAKLIAAGGRLVDAIQCQYEKSSM